MAKGVNQKIKILYLMKIFYEETDDLHQITLSEIISHLNSYGVSVERKALYDDIETLKTFGMDIVTTKGKTTTYGVGSRDFELPELKLLVDAVQSSKFITEKKSVELIKKISSFTSRFEGVKLNRQVHVTNRTKTVNESIYYAVDFIHEAINTNKKISFQYFRLNENKEKVLHREGKKITVSPMALTWDDENYYLIAYEKEENKVKHFRVDKMQGVTLLDEPCDSHPSLNHFDTALYSKKSFGMFGGVEESVTLRCKNSLSGVIIDRFGTDVPFIKHDDTSFDISVRVYTSPLFFGWLMNFGGEIELVEPKSTREKFKNYLKETLEIYK